MLSRALSKRLSKSLRTLLPSLIEEDAAEEEELVLDEEEEELLERLEEESPPEGAAAQSQKHSYGAGQSECFLHFHDRTSMNGYCEIEN